jgi:hypothetical protein
MAITTLFILHFFYFSVLLSDTHQGRVWNQTTQPELVVGKTRTTPIEVFARSTPRSTIDQCREMATTVLVVSNFYLFLSDTLQGRNSTQPEPGAKPREHVSSEQSVPWMM